MAQATLIIRGAQLEVMEADIRRRIKTDAIAGLRRTPPRVKLPDDNVLHALLDVAEREIGEYRGNFARDAERYLRLMLELGSGFRHERWASDVIEDPDIPGISTLDVLLIHAAHRRASGSGSAR